MTLEQRLKTIIGELIFQNEIKSIQIEELQKLLLDKKVENVREVPDGSPS